MIAHFVEISVFAKPEENAELIRQGLISLLPFSLEDEKVKLIERNAVGFHDRIIKIFEVRLEKEKHTNQFVNWLFQNLSEHTKQTIKTQLESRIDEHLYFFLRFDKNKWIKNRELFLVDHGDCYHIKITIAVFPKKKNNVINKIKQLLNTTKL